ncbi:MAG: FRG domain-containing protein [Caulobacter sp.]|nr:FRG domain-containing protein [Caulobacter sp.]
MDYHVENGEAALKLCREILQRGEAQLFRGQTHDWPRLIPSLFRSAGEDRETAVMELEAFSEWAANAPQMATYWQNPEAIVAIAQHYAIATTLLDLTDDPEIALLFSKPQADSKGGESVIYCFDEEALHRLDGLHLIRIDVHNLWRLEAQSGLFLEFHKEELGEVLRASATRIYFPSETLSAAERTRLYPVRKSALEVVIDQWLYRRELEQLLGTISENMQFNVTLRRHSYRGAFRWRQPPELEASWIKGELGWVFPNVESLSVASDPIVISIPLPIFDSSKNVLDQISTFIRNSIENIASQSRFFCFEVELPPNKSHLAGSVGTLLNRCWDGIRQLPYRDEDRISCLALTAALLLARTMEIEGVDKWPEQLFGELEILEAAPIGGHIEAGVVSKTDLIAAFSNEHHDRFTAYMRRKATTDPLFLMNYIVDHWMLFDFNRFQRLFVCQLVPTMIDGYWKEDLNLYDGALGCLWSLSFNPALLGYVTSSEYRFHSPLGLTRDCSRIVYIFPDMDQHDIEEVFVSCMPWILGGGRPYEVLFHGYAMDPRAVWKIAKAVRHAKLICDVGGISPLEVMPTFKEVAPSKESEAERLLGAQGIGAFEIWLMAKNKIAKMNGKPIHAEHPVFQRFWRDLLDSNARIEERAKNEADWPGPFMLNN